MTTTTPANATELLNAFLTKGTVTAYSTLAVNLFIVNSHRLVLGSVEEEAGVLRLLPPPEQKGDFIRLPLDRVTQVSETGDQITVMVELAPTVIQLFYFVVA